MNSPKDFPLPIFDVLCVRALVTGLKDILPLRLGGKPFIEILFAVTREDRKN